MPNFAQITLIGHLGRDPETKNVGDATVASFSIAVTDKVKGEEVTSWYSCDAWNKQAEVVGKYLHKGDPVQVIGRPRIEQYAAKDGTVKTTVRVRVSEFTLLGNKRQDADVPQAQAAKAAESVDPIAKVRAELAKRKGAPADDSTPF